MKLKQKGGITSKIIRVFLQDASSLSGGGLTGLTNASAGLTIYYIREGAATAIAVTLVAGTVGTYVASGFKEVDATNMPGLYELCLPNAALAAGAQSVTVYIKGATNLLPCLLEIELDGIDYQTSPFDASGRVVLQSTGLDAITVADIVSDADSRSTFPKMIRALFNRHFNLVASTASQMTVQNDGGTVTHTMAVSDDGTTSTKTKSS